MFLLSLSVSTLKLVVFNCVQGILRATQDHDVGGAIAHFFNCYTGHDTQVGSSITSSEKIPDSSIAQASVKAGTPEKGKKKGKGGKKSVDSGLVNAVSLWVHNVGYSGSCSF